MRLSLNHELSMKLSRKPELSIKLSQKPIFYKYSFQLRKQMFRPKGPAKKINLAPILSEKNSGPGPKTQAPPPPPNIKWTVPLLTGFSIGRYFLFNKSMNGIGQMTPARFIRGLFNIKTEQCHTFSRNWWIDTHVSYYVVSCILPLYAQYIEGTYSIEINYIIAVAIATSMLHYSA